MADLSRLELLALREIRLTGRTTQESLVGQLLDEKIIVDVEGCLDLRPKVGACLCGGRYRCGPAPLSNAMTSLSSPGQNHPGLVTVQAR